MKAMRAELAAIAVPLTANTAAAMQTQLQAFCQSPAQVAEWRVDAWPDVDDQTAAIIGTRVHAAGKLLLMTLRTHAEGGAFTGEEGEYVAMYSRLGHRAHPDAIDVTDIVSVTARLLLLEQAHRHDCAVVASHHDFQATPIVVQAEARLRAQAAWADVVKLAAMPQEPADTLNLLAISAWARANLAKPAIVIGMGTLGQLTRIAAGPFAPALTFASLGAVRASGQLSVATVSALQVEQK
ncbi:type I 3-dehydroquinate dehydratase [Lacticaseibacillus zhaodongensis]|uniref:type I 3-dehydroquinate dehydratase n=1 Tax=Lacticaseibacillus zhaodongensis TaxID=2668065 RepID=UPI001E5E8488|nr:type I 3-dehydroquinate dehydratase [Lacticaseibacillus zhaodongensis]